MPASPESATDGTGVGAYLRASREARGLTLDDAAKVTRLSKSYLDALEHEDYGRLPNAAYCKGFLRIYAGYLGLSGDDVVARYERATEPAKVQPVTRSRPERDGGDKGRPRRESHRWLLPLGLLVAVLILANLIDTDQRPPIRRPPYQPQAPAPLQSKPVQQGSSSAQHAPQPVVAPAAVQPPAAAVPPAPGGSSQEGLILRIKVNQDSWLNVDVDGRFSQQYELKAGDLIEWKAENVITLDMGNAGGLEGELNGKALAPFGPTGKKAHLVIGPEGTER